MQPVAETGQRGALVRLYAAVGLCPVALSPRLKPTQPVRFPKQLGYADILELERQCAGAYGIGCALPAGWLAVEIEQLEAFLRWLQGHGVQLPATTTVERPTGWTLLYRLEGGACSGVREVPGGRVLGAGAVVALPDTPGLRFLAGLEALATVSVRLCHAAGWNNAERP